MTVEHKHITRRKFIRKTATMAAAAAMSPILNTASSWAAPAGTKLQLKLRQDFVPDPVMNMFLKSFNSINKDINAKSSYINSDRGWDYEIAHSDASPPWYFEGESCDLFLGRAPAFAQLAQEEKIIPLDNLIDSSAELSRADFHRSEYASVLDALTYKNTLWGVPIAGNPYALFCNRKLFAAAAVNEYPKTWDAAVAAAKSLTRDTNSDGRPDVFGYSQCSFQFPIQIVCSGLGFINENTRTSTFDTDEALNALDTYRRLISCSPDHVNFENGDIAMKLSVTTNAFGKYKHIDHEITALPAGKRRANLYGDSDGVIAFAIPAGTGPAKTQAAWRLIEHMTSERLFFKLADLDKTLPLRNSILNGEKYKNYLSQNPQMKPFAAELQHAIPRPCVPEFRFIETVMRDILLPVQTGDPMSVSLAVMKEHLKRKAELVNLKLAARN